MRWRTEGGVRGRLTREMGNIDSVEDFDGDRLSVENLNGGGIIKQRSQTE